MVIHAPVVGDGVGVRSGTERRSDDTARAMTECDGAEDLISLEGEGACGSGRRDRGGEGYRLINRTGICRRGEGGRGRRGREVEEYYVDVVWIMYHQLFREGIIYKATGAKTRNLRRPIG